MNIANTAAASDAEYSQLLELATRLRSPVRGLLPVKDQPQIYVGKLPDHLSIELPFPDQSNILGSVEREAKEIEIILEVESPAEAVIEFYEEEMDAAGWTKSSFWDHSKGGFTGHARIESASFCFGPQGPMLNIAAGPPGEKTSDLRIHLMLGDRPECDQKVAQRFLPSPIPSLISPKGEWKSGGGSTGTNDHRSSSGTLDTSMPLIEVLEYYGEQLENAEWKRIDSVHGRKTACSNWALQDVESNDWIGILLISQADPSSTLMFVDLIARRAQGLGG